MSEVERNKGKLIPVDNVDDVVKKLNIDTSKTYYDSIEENIADNSDDHIIINGTLYKVEWEVKRNDDEMFAIVNEYSDGTIDFHTMHHNGGCSLEEVIEDSLEN